MKIVLLRSATVHGRAMHAGDELDCPAEEAKLWCALAWARHKDDDDESKPRRYRRRDMRAED